MGVCRNRLAVCHPALQRERVGQAVLSLLGGPDALDLEFEPIGFIEASAALAGNVHGALSYDFRQVFRIIPPFHLL
jgi:hypothetical protein